MRGAEPLVNILVTGGAGFIGSHLTAALLSRRHRVVCLDNLDPFYDPAIKRANIKPYKNHAKYTFVKGDICDRKTVSKIFKMHRYDVCIHLAAKAGVRPSIDDPYAYERVNVLGTLNLLEEAGRARTSHFIFGSSSSVYGVRNTVPFSEDDALLSPASPYAGTKISGEALCHVYHHLYGLKATVLRFFTVYGPRQRPEMAIHKFVRAIWNDEPVTIYGDGSARRDYTYVSDIIGGILAALEGPWRFEIINLGDSRATSLSNLVELIECCLGKKAKFRRMADQPGDVPVTFAEISKARRLLEYDPQVGIEEGIGLFCKWFRENS